MFDICRKVYANLLYQHINMGRLFRSFTIGTHICILKAIWIYHQAFCLCFVFTKSIYFNYTDVRARRTYAGQGRGRRGCKLHKIPKPWVFLEHLSYRTFLVFPNVRCTRAERIVGIRVAWTKTVTKTCA